jgi:hypothetical protein
VLYQAEPKPSVYAVFLQICVLASGAAVGFSQFTRERQLLSNVTPATIEWHKHSLKWLSSESPSQDELKDTVLRMREKRLKATGCNSAIRQSMPT